MSISLPPTDEPGRIGSRRHGRKWRQLSKQHLRGGARCHDEPATLMADAGTVAGAVFAKVIMPPRHILCVSFTGCRSTRRRRVALGSR